MARLLRIEYPGAVYPITSKENERSKRRWRDRQDHAEKEGVANKIDLPPGCAGKDVGSKCRRYIPWFFRISKKSESLTIVIFWKCFRESKCLSPVTTKSALAATAHSRIRLSGSSERRWRRGLGFYKWNFNPQAGSICFLSSLHKCEKTLNLWLRHASVSPLPRKGWYPQGSRPSALFP